MDPYLENPALFPGLRNRLIAVLSESLQTLLPAPYFAEIGERVWVEVSQRFIEPDTSVLHGVRTSSAPEHGAGTATAAARGRSVVITVPHDERREPFVEIRTIRDDGERLVTAIELLSPSNKTPGERGRELYLRKQREVLDSTIHLLEIDLLRGGVHTTAVPLERLMAEAGPFDYHVCLDRFDRFEDYVVYPIRLEEPLPEVEVPLLPGNPPVLLDLQSLFDRAYDAGPYHRRVRYAEETPVPSLRPKQAEWVARMLRERGSATA
jgi:hypothetical protein